MSIKTEEAKIVEQLETLEGNDYQTDYYPVSKDWLTQALATYKASILSECEKAINSAEVKGNRVGAFALGDKVLEFANELLTEFKTQTLQAITSLK